MFELKITVTAPDVSEAMNNLADALRIRATCAPVSADVNSYGTAEAPAEAQETAPANPTVPAQNVPAEPVQTVPSAASTTVQNDAPATVAPTAPTAPVTPAAPTVEAPTPAATPERTYTVEDIIAAGSYLLDNGKLNELMGLLVKHGVQAVNQLKPEQYPSIAAGMRELGAKI